jgi:hypothetical protein
MNCAEVNFSFIPIIPFASSFVRAWTFDVFRTFVIFQHPLRLGGICAPAVTFKVTSPITKEIMILMIPCVVALRVNFIVIQSAVGESVNYVTGLFVPHCEVRLGNRRTTVYITEKR